MLGSMKPSKMRSKVPLMEFLHSKTKWWMPSAKKLPPSVKIYYQEEVVSKDSIVKAVFAKKKFV